MGRGFESFRPCQKPKNFLRLYFFVKKLAVRNEFSPSVLRRLENIVENHRIDTLARFSPYFHRARQKKQQAAVFPSLTFRPHFRGSAEWTLTFGSPTARKHSRLTRGFTASDTPCFARAHREKRLMTVFPSLTFRPCQKPKNFLRLYFFLRKK